MAYLMLKNGAYELLTIPGTWDGPPSMRFLKVYVSPIFPIVFYGSLRFPMFPYVPQVKGESFDETMKCCSGGLLGAWWVSS